MMHGHKSLKCPDLFFREWRTSSVRTAMNVKGLSECDNLGKNLNLRIFFDGVETMSERVDTGLL
jgi:hypothetical protein